MHAIVWIDYEMQIHNLEMSLLAMLLCIICKLQCCCASSVFDLENVLLFVHYRMQNPVSNKCVFSASNLIVVISNVCSRDFFIMDTPKSLMILSGSPGCKLFNYHHVYISG
jgi:hypothetical protein